MTSSQRSLPPALLCRDGGLLTGDQPLDSAPHVHPVGVGGDVDEALFAVLVEAPLLRFDHLLVLKKGRSDLAIKLLRRLGIVLPIAIRRRPEVKAAGLGLRRQTVEQPELEAEVALRVVGCGACVGGTRPLQDCVWRNEFEFLATVDPALKTACLHIARWR